MIWAPQELETGSAWSAPRVTGQQLHSIIRVYCSCRSWDSAGPNLSVSTWRKTRCNCSRNRAQGEPVFQMLFAWLVWFGVRGGEAGQDCTLHQEHRAHNTSHGFRIVHCADSTTSGLGDVHGALRITHSYRSTHCTWRMVHKARQGAAYCTWCMVGAA